MTNAPSRRWAIGLDVGGTKIAGGVVCLDCGEIVARETIATRPDRGGEAVLADAVALARRLATEAKLLELQIEAIGIGVPELVSPDRSIRSRHVIDWQHLPVVETFATLARPVIVADVRAAALAEATLGAGAGYRIVAYVTIGTGISSCIVIDGEPLEGARGNALVLASAPLDTLCAVCGKRSRQVLEEYASGPAIVDRFNQATGATAVGAEEVLAAAAADDAVAIDILRASGEATGNSVGFLVNIIDPGIVVIGGGLGSVAGVYWDALAESARAHIWSPETQQLPIVRAALGPDSGLIGAALSTTWGAEG